MKPRALAIGHGALWVGMNADLPGTPDLLARVDRRTFKTVRSFPVPEGIQGLVSTPASLWVLHRLDSALVRFDTRLERFGTRVGVGRTPLGDATYAGGFVWALSPEEDTVAKIRDDSGQKVVIGVGRRPTGIAGRGTQIWVTSLIDHTVSRIDPAANAIVGAPVKVPLNPYALALTDDSVWLTALARGEVAHIRYR
jgi:DNA-binding beta-propeller fold protein YncE